MIVTEVEPEHLEKITLADMEQEFSQSMHMNLQGLVQALSVSEAKTFIYDGQILAIAGITPMWGKVGEAWVLSSTYASFHALALARSITKEFDRIIGELNYLRVQAQVSVGNKSVNKWMKKLGFKQEAIAQNYMADGSNAVIWVRISDGS